MFIEPTLKTTNLKLNPQVEYPFLFKSGVVYKFTCTCDNDTSRLGATQRHLLKQIGKYSGSTSDSVVLITFTSAWSVKTTTEL